MRTIIFPVLQGVVIKNLLRTDFFDILRKNKDTRIVLLVNSEEKKEYLKKDFGDQNILYEVIRPYKTPSLNGIFTFLKFNLLRTRRMDIRRKIYLNESGNYLGYFFKLAINRIFARGLFRKIVRKLDMSLVKDDNLSYLFDLYLPDLVLSAHPFGDIEMSLIRQAKKRGVLSIGIINSWDKMTSRSTLRVLPDKMAVHNDVVKSEVMEHADMDEKDIVVVGVPHYDDLFVGKPRRRSEFYSRFEIDPNKKILLFCPTGQHYSKDDSVIINTLTDLESRGLIGDNIQIFVRFPPNDTVDMSGIKDPGRLIIYQPGFRFSSKRGIDWDMDAEDIQLLHDTLFWSSVVICPPSSISIDASIVDRPIINIRFGDTKTYSTDNINLYYDSDHYGHILKHGGIRLVSSEDELTEWIKKYLDNPACDRSGRQAIVKEQCWKTDGQSSRRLAEFVINNLVS